MNTIQLDPATSEKLRGQLQSFEVLDQNGAVLGRFFPHLTEEQRRNLEPPPLSEEELEQILSEPSYTTAEVMAYLEGLDVRGEMEQTSAKRAS